MIRKSFLIAGIVSVVFALALAETGLRLYIHFRYGVPGKSYGLYMSDPELGAVHRPNSYNSGDTTNNLGLRNNEETIDKKPKDALRIYCSGGSTTYCYNLPVKDSWPAVLEQKLRQVAGHEHDEVLNAGEICFSIAHEFILAKRLIPKIKPDFVIIFTGLNEDLNADLLQKADGENLDHLLNQRRFEVVTKSLDQSKFLIRNSVLIRLLKYYVLNAHFESKAKAKFEALNEVQFHPWVLANFDHTLRSYLKFLKANHCHVIMLRYGDTAQIAYAKSIRFFRDRAVAIGREEGASICDLVAAVKHHPNRRALFIDTGFHVTKEGSELYAEALKDTILRIHLHNNTGICPNRKVSPLGNF